MRIGLIAALRRSEEGVLRTELPLAGRPVLAWQAGLLRSLGAERVLCLNDSSTPTSAMLALQHGLEGSGVSFHALKGIAAIPALVRAEDDLVIIADGLVPDDAVVRALMAGEGGLARVVASLPADHPLAAAHPADFERIDAARCWAGVLAMRGAPVQQLADMPADADAISLLLRLALQAGTPIRDLAARELAPGSWLLADSATVVAAAAADRIARAAPPADWRAPAAALAGLVARALVPMGLGQGALIAGTAALLLVLVAVLTAAFGSAAIALLLAGLGAFAAQVVGAMSTLAARLGGAEVPARRAGLPGGVVDAAVALSLWFALAPWPMWNPLAVLGPLTIGLARLAVRTPASALAVPAADRASLVLVLALGAALGQLPLLLACVALGLLAALLLHASQD